jgi:proteic killer suppression protein
MIISFGDKTTEALFHGRKSKQARKLPPDIKRIAVRKLDMVNAARALHDLRSPPANRLEALKGDLKGFFSIRINDQWRIIFRWDVSDAHEVQIIDYHS